MNQVKALKNYVADSIYSLSDQISIMLKSLSDTMFTAIGIVLASFIGALFKDKFDPNIFRIGLVTYGFYVLIFPLIYNIS